MNNFIRLTTDDANSQVFVNPNEIIKMVYLTQNLDIISNTSVHEKNKKTRIYMSNDGDDFMDVLETPNEIDRLITEFNQRSLEFYNYTEEEID